jgi:hypothetical protein
MTKEQPEPGFEPGMDQDERTVIECVRRHFAFIRERGHVVRGVVLAIAHRGEHAEECAHTVIVRPREVLPVLGAIDVLRAETQRHISTERFDDATRTPEGT